jgi:DMSO/TMAO reductase YedYZ molybdopterin-dependent catalytic subunit
MRQKIFLFALLAVLLVVGLVSCGSGAPQVDWEVKVSGDVETPLTLTYTDLVGMPQTDLKDVMMEKSTGEDVVTSWSGVALAEIFAKAGVTDYATVTATAADGYAIEITRDELEGAIIALKDGDQWISAATPDKGPIRLVCPETPGNRWVYQLTEMQVNK